MNPNTARPVLSISYKPIALEAYKAKIKLKEHPDVLSNTDQRGAPSPSPYPGLAAQDAPLPGSTGSRLALDRIQTNSLINGAIDLHVAGGLEQGSTGPASRPIRKPSRGPQPFIEIMGAVSSSPVSWTDAVSRKAAFGKWVSLIARDVGKQYVTHTERTAAEAFVRDHRLSIANAFERRLVRKDVVAVG